MTLFWNRFTDKLTKKYHGDIHFYRRMYEGEHAEIFPRAIALVKEGEIVDSMQHGIVTGKQVQVPYMVANISKVIVDIPALFVSGSIGEVKSSLPNDELQNESVNEKSDGLIDGTNDETVNGKIESFQQELIDQISHNSDLVSEHKSNIVQLQVDGGILGVPWKDDDGISIQFKSRDMYYPHPDKKGADMAEVLEDDDDNPEFLHIYRERIEKGNLRGTHFLYRMDKQGELEEVEESEAMEILDIEEMETLYVGRSRLLMKYLAHEKTFMNPLGVSILKGQENKQDEINWTLTRTAITFERNGKPRIAISKEVMQRLQDIAMEQYGDASKIDHRNMEIMTFDDQGKAMEIVQLDITKIGDFTTVKNYIKQMLQETQTSEKAVDFYLDGGGSGAQSGIAKYYDLLITLMKAQQIRKEYVSFIQDLFEGALWLANQDDSKVRIERPEVENFAMLQYSEGEMTDKNNASYAAKTMSLETVVKRNNPGRSDSLLKGRSTLMNMLDNRPVLGAAAAPGSDGTTAGA